jgi:hypothetical protein
MRDYAGGSNGPAEPYRGGWLTFGDGAERGRLAAVP